ncbi:MAG: hypothetical protein L7F77_07130 [Candidatus Magnetominusculus sp. LBB02]|nr:hypothetical protein [Candidatus Magnetominusculus sp. LBB02]
MRSSDESFRPISAALLTPGCKTTGFFFLVAMMLLQCVVLNSTVCADPPYTFSSGTTAKSSEVNSNFAYVNYGNIVLKDGNGNELGTLISDSTFLNPKGYIVQINTYDKTYAYGALTIYNLVYTSSGCTGATYIAPNGMSNYFAGKVVNDGMGNLYYIAKNTSPTTITAYSQSQYGAGCVNVGGGFTTFGFAALPNDSSITGVSSSSVALPITIGRR